MDRLRWEREEMTESEVIDLLTGQLTFNELNREAKEMAISALKKQIPKKVEIRKATDDDIESELRDFITVKGEICRCPSCRCCIHISELKYCWECGQKLDWSVKNE